MRVVHVAPRRFDRDEPFEPGTLALAREQARCFRDPVQIVAAADEVRSVRVDDLELRTFAGNAPRWSGRSRSLRHHLSNCPLELIHAHCPGQRAMHYAHLSAQRHGAPLVVSPAGALGFGKAEHLHLRCLFHRMVTHPQALEDASGWHATTAEEAEAIHACGFKQPICVAPPGVEAPSSAALDTFRKWWIARLPSIAGRPVALCTDPLEPRSGLHELIAIWGDSFTADWILLIVGRPGAESVTSLMETARRHNAADRVVVGSPAEAPPHAAARLLISIRRSDADLAPVASALAAGLPALVTDQLPWGRLTSEGVGWCVPRKELRTTLKRIFSMGPDELSVIGRNARDLARREFDWTHTAETLLGFYRHLAA